MGKTFSKENVYAKILFLGLEDSGKTTLLYNKIMNGNITTVATDSHNIEILPPIEGLSMAVWDLGGHKSIRRRWEDHFDGTDGIIFVVDSANQRRFIEVKDELFKLFDNDVLNGVPICVIAHKQDLPDAESPNDLVDLIDMREVVSHEWRVFGTSTVTGTGIDTAFNNFAMLVKRNLK
ncbi:ADP-ribosylation factor 1-like [Oopsacas minuta]|uniref:ADP-ribosylation factor 1-like n=1 Tax=Oopsacas minuta TaxID=111878 RepID=A0AAV7K696_9METZ|nr:ADP-ribosylation factor 1-like [Oopsacas minuta]